MKTDRLDGFLKRPSVMSLTAFLVQACSHAYLHIWGMLIPFFALARLYFESVTFKMSNQNGRRR